MHAAEFPAYKPLFGICILRNQPVALLLNASRSHPLHDRASLRHTRRLAGDT